MEMQNVLQQMTDMLSTNGSNDRSSNSFSGSITGSQFHSVMSGQLSKAGTTGRNIQSTRKDSSNPVGVQTLNEKRQQELQTSVNQTKNSQKDNLGSKEVVSVVDGDDVQSVKEEVVTSEEMEAAAWWIGSVQQQICQELSITPEELERVMEELGLQFSDLQNMGNVQQLVLAVSGENNVTALLTNEGLSSHVQNIMHMVDETIREVAQQFETSEDEFAQLLVKAETAMEGQDIEPEQTESVTTKQQPAIEFEAAGLEEQKSEPMKEDGRFAQESVQVTQDTEEPTVVTEDLVGEQQAEGKVSVTETDGQNQETLETLDTVTVTQQETSKTGKEREKLVEDTVDADTKQVDVTKSDISSKEESDGEMENSSDGKDFFKEEGQQPNSTSVMEQVMNQVSNVKAQFAETIQDKVQVTQQMQEIFEQVVEQVKVTVTADTSEMEMQLNPESLGKVNLSVVAKEGHITAQFVTENEVARQALESQIQQLRATLGEQGLKVDKVEVSVSDFNFQNGNQANAEEQKQQQREEHARQVQRNLNLANLDDLADMTEAEELAVKIMQSNGNQIDYTA